MPAKVFQSKISVDKFKFNYMSKLTRREVQHMAQLQKAKASIEAQIQLEKIRDDQKEEKTALEGV